MTEETETLAIRLRDKCNRRLTGNPVDAVGLALQLLMISLLVSMSENEQDCLEGLDAMAGDIRQGIKSHYGAKVLAGKVAGNA